MADSFDTPGTTTRGKWLVRRSHYMLDLVREAASDDPRGAQVHVGPSELGTPCVRKLALKALKAPERCTGIKWRPFVGTAVHAALASRVAAVAPKGRLMTEVGLMVEDADDPDDVIAGSSDVLLITNEDGVVEVIDWKIVAKSTLAKANAGNVDDKYEVQLDVYGLGVERTLGLRPARVTVIFLPSAGDFHEARVVSKDYDPGNAQKAIDRYHRIRSTARSKGLPYVVESAPTAEDFCASCSYLGVEVTDTETGATMILCRGNTVESKEREHG